MNRRGHRDRANQPAQGLPRWQLAVVYASAAVVFASGAVWLGLHYFGAAEGEFGPQPHPWKHAVLVCHGGVAPVLLWIFGSLSITHIRRGWRAHRNRTSGAWLVAALSILTISGWMLYYVGLEQLRSATAVLHWVIGLALAGLLPLHVVLGRRAEPQSPGCAPLALKAPLRQWRRDAGQ